jgi:hypothetical protein
MPSEMKNDFARREAAKLPAFLQPLLLKSIENFNNVQGDFYEVVRQTSRSFSGQYNHADLTKVAFALEVWYDEQFK